MGSRLTSREAVGRVGVGLLAAASAHYRLLSHGLEARDVTLVPGHNLGTRTLDVQPGKETVHRPR
jgi:hypothetical protein